MGLCVPNVSFAWMGRVSRNLLQQMAGLNTKCFSCLPPSSCLADVITSVRRLQELLDLGGTLGWLGNIHKTLGGGGKNIFKLTSPRIRTKSIAFAAGEVCTEHRKIFFFGGMPLDNPIFGVPCLVGWVGGPSGGLSKKLDLTCTP